jgi:hypothetical protein
MVEVTLELEEFVLVDMLLELVDVLLALVEVLLELERLVLEQLDCSWGLSSSVEVLVAVGVSTVVLVSVMIVVAAASMLFAGMLSFSFVSASSVNSAWRFVSLEEDEFGVTSPTVAAAINQSSFTTSYMSRSLTHHDKVPHNFLRYFFPDRSVLFAEGADTHSFSACLTLVLS